MEEIEDKEEREERDLTLNCFGFTPNFLKCLNT